MELNPKAEHKEQALKVLKVCDQNRSYLNPLIKPLTQSFRDVRSEELQRNQLKALLALSYLTNETTN
jgi:hypothetical protein